MPSLTDPAPSPSIPGMTTSREHVDALKKELVGQMELNQHLYVENVALRDELQALREEQDDPRKDYATAIENLNSRMLLLEDRMGHSPSRMPDTVTHNGITLHADIPGPGPGVVGWPPPDTGP